ncbi:MAG: ABC transporter permease [Rhodanobacteraceae bacterium]
MRLPPLLASLTRHRLIVLLMVLTVAFTCAIVTNIAGMIVHRLALLDAPSGLQEHAIATIDSSWIAASHGGAVPDHDRLAQYQADVASLRGIPGVESAVVVSGMPFDGGMGFNVSASGNTGKKDQGFQVTGFAGGPGELKTLGLRLMRGRDFLASEYLPSDNGDNLNKISVAILSQALAERLFHTGDAVGRLFYASGHPIRVVGVVEHLMGMSPQLGAADNEYAMLLPLKPNGDYVTFVIRANQEVRDRVLTRAVDVLGQRDPLRVFDHAQTFTQLRAQYFRRDNAMIGLLLAVGAALLLVTAAGAAGLESFWAQQRTHAIGIRRALGATRVDILRYFQTENFLIVTGGVVIGCVLAYGLNLLLMKYYALQVLPPVYPAVGAVALWLIGQAAVLGPALRAATVPPAAATRSA